MIASHPLEARTAFTAMFVSLSALVACAVDDRSFDPDAPPAAGGTSQASNGLDPGNQGGGPGNTDNPGGSGAAGTPSNEQDPTTGVPFVPGANGGSGGNGSVPEEPPPPEALPFLEDTGEDCAVPALAEVNDLAPVATLPDPFLKLNGSRITTRAEWRCRRQEIKAQAEKYVYGEKPLPPDMVSGTVSSTSITVNVTDGGASTSFTVNVELPATGTAPYPALISLGGAIGFSHSALVRAEGVAIISYDQYAIGAEAGTRGSKAGAFYDLYGAQRPTGLLAAWAWGASRIIDVIEQSDGTILKADALGVAGCSRLGKGAFAVGAFDERVALTIPFESGSGGIPIWRGLAEEGGQTAASAYGETYWLGDAFGSFTANVNLLPVDTHEVIAMIAPRGLLILDNPHIASLAPRSAHVAALAGAEVYAALGAAGNISYHSAVASGSHCAARAEHQEPLREHLRKFLLGTGNQPNVLTAASATTGNLAEWRTWNTLSLQ